MCRKEKWDNILYANASTLAHFFERTLVFVKKKLKHTSNNSVSLKFSRYRIFYLIIYLWSLGKMFYRYYAIPNVQE